MAQVMNPDLSESGLDQELWPDSIPEVIRVQMVASIPIGVSHTSWAEYVLLACLRGDKGVNTLKE